MQRTRWLTILVLSAAVLGCKTPAPTASSGARPVLKKASPAPAPSASVGGVTPGPGTSVISNNGSSLVGVAQAPASLVGNNGSNFRVLATLAQVPVAKAKVRLLEADLQPVVVGGRAVETETDATGRYGFTAALPDRNLLVEIALPDGKGALQAIAPKGTGARNTDADLVSTLTTAYILDQYVKGQADPVATLNKLPADVEQQTRQKAGAAFEGGSAAVPETLTTAAVVATVETLRQNNPTFNAQLETVKQLLVAAGQSDFGEGRKATEVGLNVVHGLIPLPDGGLLIHSRRDSRVWRLTPEGTLVTELGSGTHKEGSLAGQTGPTAGLRFPLSVTRDAKGRLIVLDHPFDPADRTLPRLFRLSRLEADGKFVDLWPGLPAALGAWPSAGDTVLVFGMGNRDIGEPAKLWEVSAGQAPVLKHTFTAEQTARLTPSRSATEYHGYGSNRLVGQDTAGALYIGVPGEAGTVHRIAPDTYDVQHDYATEGERVDAVTMDGAGNVFTLVVEPTGRKLMVKKPGGAFVTLAPTLPDDFKMLPLAPAALLADGSAYVTVRQDLVFRIKDGQVAHVAGKLNPLSGSAKDISITAPAGMVINKAGDLFLADKHGVRIVKIDKNQQVSLVVGTGESKTAGDGGPASQASIATPRVLRFDAEENLYIQSGGQRVRKIDKAGIITSAYVGSSDYHARDLQVAPDGTLYISRRGHTTRTDGHINVIRVKDGVETVIIPNAPSPDGNNGFILGMAPDGTLYVLARLDASCKLYRWKNEQLELIKEDARFNVSLPNDSNGMAVDAKGRVVQTLIDQDQVLLYDPATDAIKVLAGFEGVHFNGEGVDNSLRGPRYATFDAEGNLYFDDYYHRQVKRIAAPDVR